MDPLEALHGIVDAGIGTGGLAELVQHQASAFLDRLENEFGFLKQARHVTTDGLDEVIQTWAAMPWTRCRTRAAMPAAAAQNGVDPVQDLGDAAEEKIEDLF